ncbi:Dicer-like protein 1 [Balamuthia mandrillaris]
MNGKRPGQSGGAAADWWLCCRACQQRLCKGDALEFRQGGTLLVYDQLRTLGLPSDLLLRSLEAEMPYSISRVLCNICENKVGTIFVHQKVVTKESWLPASSSSTTSATTVFPKDAHLGFTAKEVFLSNFKLKARIQENKWLQAKDELDGRGLGHLFQARPRAAEKERGEGREDVPGGAKGEEAGCNARGSQGEGGQEIEGKETKEQEKGGGGEEKEVTPGQLVRTPPRGYQVELYEAAMKRNSVLVLPTGTGKTLISAMVIHRTLQLNPSKRVVFIVDRTPLVFQQGLALHQETGLSVEVRCGERKNPLFHRQEGVPFKRPRILVCTAALFANRLELEAEHLQQYCLMVFDECHHTTKSHPYNLLMQQWYHKEPEAQRPRVLGLTASPAAHKDLETTYYLLESLLANLDSTICTSAVHAAELKEVTRNISIGVEGVDPVTSKQYRVASFLLIHVNYCISLMGYSLDIPMNALSPVEEYPLICYLQPVLPHNSSLMLHIKRVWRVWLGVLQFGFEAMREEIAFVLSETERQRAYANHRRYDSKKRDILWNIDSVLDFASTTTPQEQEQRDVFDGPKVQAVLNVLSNTLHKEGDEEDEHESMDKRVIIFVRRKFAALKLFSLIKLAAEQKGHVARPQLVLGGSPSVATADFGELDEEIADDDFDGYYDDGLDDEEKEEREDKDVDPLDVKGMSWKRQQEAVKQFKEGHANVLISTSVVEEGFDVPSCDMVLIFDSLTSATALVQCRGRARRMHSRFIVFSENKAETEEEIHTLLQQERNMHEAVARLMREGKKPALRRPCSFQTVSNKNSMQVLNEWCQKTGYTVRWLRERVSGPPHDPCFTCTMTVESICPGGKFSGNGRTKKDAQKEAAHAFFDYLQQNG